MNLQTSPPRNKLQRSACAITHPPDIHAIAESGAEVTDLQRIGAGPHGTTQKKTVFDISNAGNSRFALGHTIPLPSCKLRERSALQVMQM